MAAENDENDTTANYRRPIKPFKIALAGAYGAGKTSLFRRMLKKDFYEERHPSGVDRGTHKEIFVDEETVINMEIWDTADMEKHGSITLSYYRGSTFVLLVYSADNEETLYKIRVYADDVKRYVPAAKLILVRNKIDLPIGDEGVSAEKEKRFIRNLKQKILANFWTSAKTNEGVENLLRDLGKHSLKMFKNRRQSEGKDGFRLDLDDEPQHTGYSCCR